VTDVHKKFRVYSDKGHNLKERLLFRNRNRHEDRWVLRGIDFEVARGDSVGLIGENGSGKSTLLKLVTRIMYPDRGNIEVKGRVSSLIELGAGFHPNMSGRENIYTNASIFGLSRRETDARLDDIIGFSELGEYIDNPVRTYSSGMFMRLAFSVAINVDADVLLIDEILAVGDVSFQAKCFDRLRSIKAAGTTIVIVSHSLGQIEQLCEKSVWINDGMIGAEGSPRDVHPRYLEYMGRKRNDAIQTDAPEELDEENAGEPEESIPDDCGRPPGTGEVKIKKVSLLNKAGEEASVFKTGEEMTLCIRYKAKQTVENPVVGAAVYRSDNLYCWGLTTHMDRFDIPVMRGEGEILLKTDYNPLLSGEYMIDTAIARLNDFDYDFKKNAVSFRVYSDADYIGVLNMPHRWLQRKD
jgi:ABC-2 type transport system ATP-binding protein